MSTDVFYSNDEPDNFDKVLHSYCECGHQLYQHGFVFGFQTAYTGPSLRVSQCVMCDCKQFHGGKDAKDSSVCQDEG